MVDRDNYSPGAWDLVSGRQRRRVNHAGTQDFFVDIAVELLMDRRSKLDRKVAVLPLICSASLLLATFWTLPSSSARLRLNAFCCLMLVITMLATRFMLPSAGGSLPLIIQFNTGLVVLALIQLALALSLGNLVTRTDCPPLWLVSGLERVAPLLCLGDLPLIGRLPSVVPPWGEHRESIQAPEASIGGAGKVMSGWEPLAQTGFPSSSSSSSSSASWPPTLGGLPSISARCQTPATSAFGYPIVLWKLFEERNKITQRL